MHIIEPMDFNYFARTAGMLSFIGLCCIGVLFYGAAQFVWRYIAAA